MSLAVMDSDIDLERNILLQEYKNLLHEEVDKVFIDLQNVLTDVPTSFTSLAEPVSSPDCKAEPQKYLLSNPNVVQHVKCMVTLAGDVIYEADLALKLQKHQVVPYQTRIYPEMPWRIQQIQDAANQVQLALSCIEKREPMSDQTSGQHVLNALDEISYHIRLARDSLTMPKRKTLEELVKNPANKSFNPPLPNDAVISFYVQGYKLVLAVYHLYTNQMNRVDIAGRYQSECVIPWLNDILLVMTLALQKCQQLRDKINIFLLYENELNLGLDRNTDIDLFMSSLNGIDQCLANSPPDGL